MTGAAIAFAALGLAGCGQPAPASTTAPAPMAPLEPTAVPAPAPAVSKVPDTSEARWRSVPTPTGLAAVFGPPRSDDTSYRMECQGQVLTLWAFHEDAPPAGKAPTDLVLRRSSGEVLVKSSADTEPDDLGSRMVFNLPGSYPADLDADLELGITLPGHPTDWARLNDVARDVLMACSEA